MRKNRFHRVVSRQRWKSYDYKLCTIKNVHNFSVYQTRCSGCGLVRELWAGETLRTRVIKRRIIFSRYHAL